LTPQVLFAKYDIYDVIESQKRRLREAYTRLTDDEAIDEGGIQRIKSEYTLDVPVLKTDEMYCVEGNIKVDVSRNPNRIFLSGTGRVMEDATELIVHIPFNGDPGVFNIAPSAYNSRIAEGVVEGHEVLLRTIVIDGGSDVQGHIDREIAQINWALNHLREKTAYASQELEAALRQAVVARKRSIESRGSVMGKLKIPIRPAALVSPAVPPPFQPQTSQPSAPLSSPGKRNHWDLFISHASEDKPYVEPLVKVLQSAGISVWYDKNVLEWGDRLRGGINNGLINCRYAIVVLSKAFLGIKKWTEHELDGLFAREEQGKTVILPIWHGVGRVDLLNYSPDLADRLAKISETDSYDDIVTNVLSILGRGHLGDATRESRAPSAVVWAAGKKAVAVAYAFYETTGPNAKNVQLYIRRSPSGNDRFTFENSSGEEHEGTRQEIAIRYALADKNLTMSGFRRMKASGASEFTEFNL
jgi:hypothetical protein